MKTPRLPSYRNNRKGVPETRGCRERMPVREAIVNKFGGVGSAETVRTEESERCQRRNHRRAMLGS